MPIATADRQPRGSVLLFTLVILVLLGLMGASLMMNTRTELSVTQSTYLGRDAFAKADYTARLALFLGRALLNQTAGDPCDFLTSTSGPAGRPGFTVRIGANITCSNSGGSTDLTQDLIRQESEMPTLEDIADRYLQATGSANAPGTTFHYKPHLTVLYGGQVVGTAALTMYYSGISDPGGSQGDDFYGSQGENSVRVYLVVSADGRLPRAPGEDSANFYSGGRTSTRSIVTAVYREIVVN